MASFLVFLTIWGNLTLTCDLDHSSQVIVTWVVECASLVCTLVLSMKSVGEIASEMWPIF